MPRSTRISHCCTTIRAGGPWCSPPKRALRQRRPRLPKRSREADGMADVFISYARADKARVAPLVAAIEAKGWSVWWDPEITPGQEFDDQIEAEIGAAKAVLVVWTPVSVASRWVRGEAREAAERGILVPVRFEQARLPMDVRAIHTTDLDDWHEDPASVQAQEFLRALAAMIARSQAAQAAKPADMPAASSDKKPAPRYTICVLPFANMSGDPDQEYFSDGITEDIITDLSKVSSLRIISRNSAFQYEISRAIAKALRLRLLPEEKKAIERRGTDSAEAYDLYLMARQMYVTGQEYDEHAAQAIIRMCTGATDIDPRYAQAWALMAIGYRSLRGLGVGTESGMDAAERALAIDPDLAEAHAVKAYILLQNGGTDAAASEAAIALKLDPESYEANRTAARVNYQLHRFEDAIRLYEKAAHLMEADIKSVMTLVSCYTVTGDTAGVRRTAELGLTRAEAILARDQNNPGVLAYSAYALMALGEGERAKARMNRTLM